MRIPRIILGILLFAVPALADVSVGCAGASGIFDFNSLSAAVNAVPDGSTINVSGTCSERVFIGQRRNLTIHGINGAVLQADPNSPGMETLDIFDSSHINVLNLDVRGDSSGPFAVHLNESRVSITDCTIEGSGGSGILSQGHVNLEIASTTIQNNNIGIRLDSGSVLDIGEGLPNNVVPSVVQGNNIYGIWVRQGAAAGIMDLTIIQNNGIGVNVENGGTAGFCCDDPDQRKVINNQVGIRVSHGTLEMRGPVLIQGNSIFGVRMIGATGTFFGSQTVDGNGSANDNTTGGVSLEGASQVDFFSTEVSNNLGFGMMIQDNSSARVFGDTITGNAGGGIRLINLSTVAVFSPNTISGNGTADLSCSPDSLAHGDSTGIGKLFCPHFSVEPVPGPKGPKPPKL